MRYLLAFMFLLLPLVQKSQSKVAARIENGDTILIVNKPEVRVHAKMGEAGKKRREAYRELVYDVKEALPYAKLFASKMQEIERNLENLETKSAKKSYLKKTEGKLKQQLKSDLKDLTYDQGRILIKLINRETGKTSYDLIKKYKSGFNAVMWQSFAAVFGMNLRNQYNPREEEAIEKILHALGHE